jgi:hypothetical protein
MMNRWILATLAFAVCSIATAQPVRHRLPEGWQIELPDGEFVGGFIEDDGNAVVLLRTTTYPGNRVEKEKSYFVRLASDGSIIDTIDPAGRLASHVQALDHGLLSLGTREPLEDGSSVLHRELIELTESGEIRRVWGLNTRDRPDWDPEYTYFTMSYDGAAWALYTRGQQPGSSPEEIYDRLIVQWGDLDPPEAETDGEAVIRFDDAESDGLWRHAWELGYPGPVFLDSSGPVLSVVWKDRTYIVHIADDGSVEHRIPLFGETSEGRSGWQPDERVQWSWTDEHLRAYRLPELGLSGGVMEPFWIVERKSQDGRIQVHQKRGVIALRGQFLWSPKSPKLIGDPEPDGRFRVDHIWRDPLASDVEVRRTTGWQGSSAGAFPYWITVSPNARFVLAVQQYTNWIRIIPMGPAPPVPEP